MQGFTIIATPPADLSDKALQKAYQKLTYEIAQLAERRRAATAEWLEHSQVIDSMRSKGARPADVAPVTVKMLELEIDLLEREMPLMSRAIDEYLPTALKCRQHLVAVMQATIPLAEQRVIALFERDYDPKQWPTSQTALIHHVAAHPIVRGAHEQLAEVNVSTEQDVLRENRQTAKNAEQRLNSLRGNLPVAKGLAEQATAAAQAEAEQAAAALVHRRQAAEVQAAAQKRIEEEARRRLGL